MTPQPVQLKLSTIEANIENGLFVIPNFQRDFVWDMEKSAKLLDSWIKGYPFGSFILWTTDEELCPVKEIGNTIVFKKKILPKRSHMSLMVSNVLPAFLLR